MLSTTMQIKILPFGVLKDWLGSTTTIELPTGATIAFLLQHLATTKQSGSSLNFLRGIAVSVNAEYAQATHVLHDGDEVGLLPPVSGGAAHTANDSETAEPTPSIVAYLTREPIESSALIATAKHAEDGAIVVFDGIVRNHSRGRQTLHLDYEAYEEMATRQIDALASEALTRFGVRHVTLVHRLGKLLIGETSVLIIVASAHRAQAYEASRWLIDTLKKTVPIWKKETFVDGAVWANGDPFPENLAASLPEAARD